MRHTATMSPGRKVGTTRGMVSNALLAFSLSLVGVLHQFHSRNRPQSRDLIWSVAQEVLQDHELRPNAAASERHQQLTCSVSTHSLHSYRLCGWISAKMSSSMSSIS